MSLHEDLRQQARHLATIDPRRPKQANLRRALSTAYYALFHLLVDEATRRALGQAIGVRDHRAVLARGFEHTRMAEVSKSFAGGALPAVVAAGTAGQAVPDALRRVAEAFVAQQNRRHAADYDPLVTFQRPEVLAALDQVDRAFDDWRRVRKHPLARLYLAHLSSYDSVLRRKASAR